MRASTINKKITCWRRKLNIWKWTWKWYARKNTNLKILCSISIRNYRKRTLKLVSCNAKIKIWKLRYSRYWPIGNTLNQNMANLSTNFLQLKRSSTPSDLICLFWYIGWYILLIIDPPMSIIIHFLWRERRPPGTSVPSAQSSSWTTTTLPSASATTTCPLSSPIPSNRGVCLLNLKHSSPPPSSSLRCSARRRKRVWGWARRTSWFWGCSCSAWRRSSRSKWRDNQSKVPNSSSKRT